MKTFQKDLPISLFFEIQSFLSTTDYYKWMRCSKKFTEIGQQTNPVESIHFQESEALRNLRKLKGINYSNIRMTITISGFEVTEELLELINEVRPKSANFALSRRLNFEKLEGIKCNQLNAKLCVDILPKQLLNLYSLDLINCTSFPDFSCLLNLHTLGLINCVTADISAVKDIPHLKLHCCRGFEDISCLRNRKIDISGCVDIKNHLSLIHAVDITLHSFQTARFSFNLMDLIQFKNAESIQISKVPGTAVASPPKLKQLKLANCDHLQNISFLGNLVELTIHYCHFLHNLNGLGNVRRLTLSWCGYMQDISAINNKKTQFVEIYRCHRISDFTPLQGIPRVIIRNCRQFQMAGQVSQVKHLTIEECHNFTRTKLLAHVQQESE